MNEIALSTRELVMLCHHDDEVVMILLARLAHYH
jgi:hypothetical protein